MLYSLLKKGVQNTVTTQTQVLWDPGRQNQNKREVFLGLRKILLSIDLDTEVCKYDVFEPLSISSGSREPPGRCDPGSTKLI